VARAQSKNFSQQPDTGVRLIALFKLAKGLLLVAVGVGVHTLVHRDVAATLTHWANVFWIARESRYLQALVYKVAAFDHRTLKITEISSFVYSAVLLTEGVGLLLSKRWAEYLTVIVTASFIPFEIFTIVRRFGVSRMIVLVINAAVVWYLCRRLWRAHRSHG
jgi:uncharacterized membrane protein (DUF2068 family)